MSDIESELRAVHRDAVSATEQSVEVAELRVRVAELEELCDDKDKTKATILAGAGGQIDELRAKVGELEQEVRNACEMMKGRILALEAEFAQAKDAAKSWKEKATQDPAPLLSDEKRFWRGIAKLQAEQHGCLSVEGEVFTMVGTEERRNECSLITSLAMVPREIVLARIREALKETAERGARPLVSDHYPCAGCYGRDGAHLSGCRIAFPAMVLCACIARSDLDTADPTCAMCHGKGEHDAEVF